MPLALAEKLIGMLTVRPAVLRLTVPATVCGPLVPAKSKYTALVVHPVTVHDPLNGLGVTPSMTIVSPIAYGGTVCAVNVTVAVPSAELAVAVASVAIVS